MRTGVCFVGKLSETHYLHRHIVFGGLLFVFVFLRGRGYGIWGWLLETRPRPRLARAAANEQRLEGCKQ